MLAGVRIKTLSRLTKPGAQMHKNCENVTLLLPLNTCYVVLCCTAVKHLLGLKDSLSSSFSLFTRRYSFLGIRRPNFNLPLHMQNWWSLEVIAYCPSSNNLNIEIQKKQAIPIIKPFLDQVLQHPNYSAWWLNRGVLHLRKSHLKRVSCKTLSFKKFGSNAFIKAPFESIHTHFRFFNSNLTTN